MDVNPVKVKPEPVESHSSIRFALSENSSLGSSQLGAVYNAVPDGMKSRPGLMSSTSCQNDGQHMDLNVYLERTAPPSNTIKSEYYTSDTAPLRMSSSALDPLVSLTHSTGKPTELLTGNTFQHTFLGIKDTGQEMVEATDSSNLKSHSLVTPKPSEALFVRALIGRCKRIAPLWFRGVSSMRERNREENRRMASNNGQTQNDWSLIGLKIAEMNPGSETDAVANLLKKLYKELPTDSVFWFLKCWLGSDDSRNDPDSCVISRGDAKGRMRRIDGGKGSDKVWRLDTIVGMLYHGLPMSSTDTNIMVHTCDQELCVRPQHIRFRASSVALVVVLKALAQAGYTVIPPPVAAGPDGVAPNASDESVDVFGPFTIEELQQYRSENLVPAEDSISKLTLNATDREFADSVPVIRVALQGTHSETQPVISSGQSMISHLNGYPPLPSTRLKIEPPEPGYRTHNPHIDNVLGNSTQSPRLGVPGTIEAVCTSSSAKLGRSSLVSSNATSIVSTSTTNSDNCAKQPCSDDLPTDGMSGSPNSVCTVPVTSVSHRLERRSLKRPAPADSPCSFPSSPVRVTLSHAPSHHHHHQQQRHLHQPAPSSSSPPLLISEMTNSLPVPHERHPSIHHRLSDSTLQPPVLLSNSTVLPCLTQTTESVSMQMCNPLIDSAGHVTVMTNSDVPFSLSRGSDGVTRLDNKSFQSNGLSTGSPGSNTMLLLHQPLALPLHHHSQPVSNGPSGFGNTGAFCFSAAIPGTGGGGSSSSGKTTPRQPAKKRLEARTPTIEGCLTDEGSNGGGTQSTPILVSGSDDCGSALLGTVSGGGGCVVAFRVHQNTPFVPVQSRSGRPSSGGSTSSGSIIPNVNVTNNTESSGGPGVSLVSTANRCLPETEEGEMDQELVDIMVRRSGSTCNSNYFPGDGAVSRSPCTLGTDENSHRSIVCPLGFPATATELGTSPTGRRIIKAFVASLTGSHGSPLHGNSTPINPRRSASACSLPRLGSSPNDDLTEFLLHSNANGNALLFSSPNACGSWQPSRDTVSFLNNQQQQQNNTSSKSHWLTEYVTTTGRRSAGSALQGGNCATPPPSLSSSTNSGTLGELRLLSGTRVLGQSILHTPTLNGDGSCAQDTSVQELTNAIRNSPACGISQELIDMLANMAQQYGVQHPRPGSGASRPSSQVAQRFYRSLVNGSVCASPFLGGTFNGSSVSGVATNTTTQALSASGGTGSSSATTTTTTANSTGATTPLLSPTGTFSSQHQTGSHHQHHLRGLSFTPLAVDADLGGSLPSGINSTTANSSDCFVAVSNGPLCTTSPTIKHSCAVENTTTLATCELRGDIAPARSANSAGNGFFPCRRPLK